MRIKILSTAEDDLRRHHTRHARGIHHLLEHVGIGRAAGGVGRNFRDALKLP